MNKTYFKRCYEEVSENVFTECGLSVYLGVGIKVNSCSFY